MPQQDSNFDYYSLSELKGQINKKIGFRIDSKSDCAKLSELIFQECKEQISESTIYRLFLNPKNNIPYQSTLKILSKFIDYTDWLEFRESLKKVNKFKAQNGISSTNVEKSLIHQCIISESFKPINALFDNLVESEQWEKDLITLSVFDSLQTLTKPHKFFNYFSDNAFFREEFFEKGVDPTFRINNYDYGFQLYLRHVKPQRSAIELQCYIFGNTMLFRHHFIDKELLQCILVGNELYRTDSIKKEELELIHIMPRIRYMAYRLWHMSLNNETPEAIEDYTNMLLDFCNIVYPTLNTWDKKFVFHTVAETFIYTNVSQEYHDQLKDIFFAEFQFLPLGLSVKSLSTILPYFEPNGLLNMRPI